MCEKENEKYIKCLIEMYDDGVFECTEGMSIIEKIKYKKDKNFVKCLKQYDELADWLSVIWSLQSVTTFRNLMIYLMLYSITEENENE